MSRRWGNSGSGGGSGFGRNNKSSASGFGSNNRSSTTSSGGFGSKRSGGFGNSGNRSTSGGFGSSRNSNSNSNSGSTRSTFGRSTKPQVGTMGMEYKPVPKRIPNGNGSMEVYYAAVSCQDLNGIKETDKLGWQDYGKSLEQLRWEDYQLVAEGKTSGNSGNSNSSGSRFGGSSNNNSSGSRFGSQSKSGFGGGSSGSKFGGGASKFGSSSGSKFGSSSGSKFGSSSGSRFGKSGTSSSSGGFGDLVSLVLSDQFCSSYSVTPPSRPSAKRTGFGKSSSPSRFGAQSKGSGSSFGSGSKTGAKGFGGGSRFGSGGSGSKFGSSSGGSKFGGGGSKFGSGSKSKFGSSGSKFGGGGGSKFGSSGSKFGSGGGSKFGGGGSKLGFGGNRPQSSSGETAAVQQVVIKPVEPALQPTINAYGGPITLDGSHHVVAKRVEEALQLEVPHAGHSSINFEHSLSMGLGASHSASASYDAPTSTLPAFLRQSTSRVPRRRQQSGGSSFLSDATTANESRLLESTRNSVHFDLARSTATPSSKQQILSLNDVPVSSFPGSTNPPHAGGATPSLAKALVIDDLLDTSGDDALALHGTPIRAAQPRPSTLRRPSHMGSNTTGDDDTTTGRRAGGSPPSGSLMRLTDGPSRNGSGVDTSMLPEPPAEDNGVDDESEAEAEFVDPPLGPHPELVSMIPTHSEYRLFPSRNEMMKMQEVDLAKMEGFKVQRPGYGSICWDGPLDVRNLALDDIVHIDMQEIVLYGSTDETQVQKPPPGEGLNIPAELELEKVYPKHLPDNFSLDDPHILQMFDKFEDKLMRKSRKMGTQFIDYQPNGGIWRFRVDNF